MTSLLTAIHGAESLLLAAARIWAVAGELISAAAMLWALDSLARLIRLTYRAGCLAGRILWPIIHALASAGRWLWANIDWAEVFVTVRAGFVVIISALIAAGQLALPALCWISERIGRWYAGRLAPVAPVVIVPPAIHPMAAMAAELEGLTCRQLQALTGCRRKARKAHLIALALAC